MHSYLLKGDQIFLFLGPCGTFLAWPPLSEIHTDLGIIITDQFCVFFFTFTLTGKYICTANPILLPLSLLPLCLINMLG